MRDEIIANNPGPHYDREIKPMIRQVHDCHMRDDEFREGIKLLLEIWNAAMSRADGDEARARELMDAWLAGHNGSAAPGMVRRG